MIAVAAATAVIVAAVWIPAVHTSTAGFTGDLAVGTSSHRAAASFGTHRDAVMADSPRGYWRLDDEPTAVDSSSSGTDGLIYGAAVPSLGALAADPDRAMTLDGLSGVRTTGTSYTFGTSAAFSIEAWVHPTMLDAADRGVAYCEQDGATEDGWYLSVNNSAGVVLQRRSGGLITSAAGTIAANVWTHVVATYDGSTLDLYEDGVLSASQSDTSALPPGTCQLMIGYPRNSLGGFVGSLDEVAVYPFALSAARVLAHYNAGSSSTYTAAVLSDDPSGYWRLTEAAVAADSSGNGHDAGYVGEFYQDDPVTTYRSPGVLTGGNEAMGLTGSGGMRVPGGAFSFDGSQPFSVEAWMRPSVHDANYRRLMSCYWTAGGLRSGWDMWHQSSYGTAFERWDAGYQRVVFGPPPPVGQWTHMVGTYDGTMIRFYTDGVLRDSASMGAISAGSCTLIFGYATFESGDEYAGELDEMAIYPAALSPDRVAIHYQRRQ